MKIDRADTKKRLFIIELRKITADNIEEVYGRNLQRFCYYKSNVVTVDGKNIERGWERFFAELDRDNRGKTASLDDKLANGFDIYESDFLEHEISRIEGLLDKYERDIPFESKKAGRAYVEFMKARQASDESKPQDTPLLSKKKTYKYDEYAEKIAAIHTFCNRSVFKNVSLHEFGECVGAADFSALYKNEETIKSKLKYVIYILSSILDDADWYKQAAGSIGMTPSKCSGANISEGKDFSGPTWKEQANALK